MPDTNAPTIGTNAPRNTSMPIANTSGTPSRYAANAMPIASVSATSTVARTKAVSEIHATWPEPWTASRALRGTRPTMNRQMRSPSYRKKNVENSTMNAPVATWVTREPNSVARATTSLSLPCTVCCARSIQVSSCSSDSPSGPSRSQSWISPMPSATELRRSSICATTCCPTSVRIPPITAMPASTTMNVASTRGTRRRTSQSTNGMPSAVSSTAMATGTVMSEKYDRMR